MADHPSCDQRVGCRASAAADLDPDSISFAKALRLVRRTATGTADIPFRAGRPASCHLADVTELLVPDRRETQLPSCGQTRPHSNYRIKKPGEPASTRHRAPATINLRGLDLNRPHDQLRLRGIGPLPRRRIKDLQYLVLTISYPP